MSLALIRQALETALIDMSPALPIAAENAAYSPVTGTPYQMMYLLPAQPGDHVFGAFQRFEFGIFQISLMYPQNTGPGAAQARAIALQAEFRRGQTYVDPNVFDWYDYFLIDPVPVHITHTPHIHPGRIDGDRWRVDIDVRYQAEVFS